MNAVLIVALLLVIVIIAGNTMIAIAFLRGRNGSLRSLKGRDGEAMDELHRRVQALRNRKK